MARQLATQAKQALLGTNIEVAHLTSDSTPDERRRVMVGWGEGTVKLLISTYNTGLDSPFCKEVVVFGLPRSNADAIQSVGRIRPRQQGGKDTTVGFWQLLGSWQHDSDASGMLDSIAERGFYDAKDAGQVCVLCTWLCYTPHRTQQRPLCTCPPLLSRFPWAHAHTHQHGT